MNIKALLAMKYRSPGEEAGAGAPAAASPAAAVETAVDVNTDWEDLSSDSDDAMDGDLGAESAQPALAPAVTAKAPAVATQIPAVTAEPAVAVQSQQTPQILAQEAAQQPPQAAPVDMTVLRQNYHNELVKNYALTPEQALQLQTEPENILPLMAANVHLEVLDAVSAQLPRRINEIVTSIIESRQRETSAQDEFFGAYPDLKAHRDSILRVGQMYRAANPSAPKDVAVKAIGDFVRQSLGLPIPGVPAATPSVAQVSNPFQPASGSGGGAPPSVMSLWDEMVQDDD